MGAVKNINKSGQKIINWSEYNASLKKRGDISCFIDDDLLNGGWYVNEKRIGKGKQNLYTDGVIELMHTVSAVYKLPYRQTQGFLYDMICNKMGYYHLKIPDYTLMSIRGKKAERIQEIRDKIKDLQEKNEKIKVVADATGVKIYGEHEWKVRTHGKGSRRKWKKLHAIINLDNRQIISAIMTDSNIHDGEIFDELFNECIKSNNQIEKFYGDGAYHQHSIIEALDKHQVDPMIPLPKNAVITNEHKDEPIMLKARERLLLRQYEAGGIEKWKKQTDYHNRSIIENTFSRLKTIFGERIRHKNNNIRHLRLQIHSLLLNRFAIIGLPRYG